MSKIVHVIIPLLYLYLQRELRKTLTKHREGGWVAHLYENTWRRMKTPQLTRPYKLTLT